MTPHLPKPLASYFAAKNKHDLSRMLEPFASDAVVQDEGETHSGHAEIHAWMTETTRKYRITVKPTEASTTDDMWLVAGVVSGDFPGSPAVLRYRFMLAGDKISRLEIGA